MKKIKVRNLTLAEVAELDMNSRFLVADSKYIRNSVGPLVPARLDSPIGKQDAEVLTMEDRGVRSIPTLLIQNEYRVMYGVGANRIYVEDPAGEEVSVVETVGTQVGLTFYAPGLEGEDVLERVHAALRSEFGIGFLQLRQQHHQPVSEAGLPPVIGVPDGQVPKLI